MSIWDMWRSTRQRPRRQNKGSACPPLPCGDTERGGRPPERSDRRPGGGSPEAHECNNASSTRKVGPDCTESCIKSLATNRRYDNASSMWHEIAGAYPPGGFSNEHRMECESGCRRHLSRRRTTSASMRALVYSSTCSSLLWSCSCRRYPTAPFSRNAHLPRLSSPADCRFIVIYNGRTRATSSLQITVVVCSCRRRKHGESARGRRQKRTRAVGHHGAPIIQPILASAKTNPAGECAVI